MLAVVVAVPVPVALGEEVLVTIAERVGVRVGVAVPKLQKKAYSAVPRLRVRADTPTSGRM